MPPTSGLDYPMTDRELNVYAGGGGGGGGLGGGVGGRAVSRSSYNPAVQNSHDNLMKYQNSFGQQWTAKNGAAAGPNGPAALQMALEADPTYKQLRDAHQSAQQAHVEGVGQLAYQHLATQDRIAGQDAGSRQISAEGGAARDRGQGAAAEGQGKLYVSQAQDLGATQAARIGGINAGSNLTNAQAGLTTSQAGLTNVEANRTQSLTPAERAIMEATAQQTNAGAGKTAAEANNISQMTPVQVNQGNAATARTGAETRSIDQDTKLRPQLVQTAQDQALADRALHNQLTQSEIVKNMRDPVTGEVTGMTPPPTATQSGPGGSPAATMTPPDDRGILHKAFDAAWMGTKKSMPIPVGAEGQSSSNYWNLLGPTVGAANFVRGAVEGWKGPQPAPAAAPAGGGMPQRKVLPDGRTVEIVGQQVFQVLPDGTRRALRVNQ